jgi:hypothetical protein
MEVTLARQTAITSISLRRTNVCAWHEADMPTVLTNVCFERKNGHCLNMQMSAYDPKLTSRAKNKAEKFRPAGASKLDTGVATTAGSN